MNIIGRKLQTHISLNASFQEHDWPINTVIAIQSIHLIKFLVRISLVLITEVLINLEDSVEFVVRIRQDSLK